ncbi:MAG: hypothetical protein HY290_12495 [Planctomycetia bacterium]|nr:hypothetical protein [Planctomycetia bacterium]
MARWCCSFCGLLAWAALCAGCAANRPGNPFGIASSKSQKSQVAKTDGRAGSAKGKSGATGRDQNVAKSPAKAKGQGSSIQDAPKTAVARNQKSPRGAYEHDPETLALIEKELRDAAPDEKAEYLADFQGMQPAAIKQVLRSRRLANNQELASRRGADPRSLDGVVTAAEEIASGAPRGGVQNAAASRDYSAASGGPRRDTYSPAGTSPVPVGHNTGYRLGQTESAPANSRDAAAARPPAVPGHPNSITGLPSATGHLANGQPAAASPYLHAGGASAAAPPQSPTIRPAVVTIGAPTTADDPSTTGRNPADQTSPAQLARLISVVEGEAQAMQPGETEGQKQDYIKKQVDLRMLYLMAGQQERALQAIPGLEPADQEFWQQMFWGLTNYFDSTSIPSGAERAAQTVTQMQNAVLRLQEKANLELRNVSFCHRISSFGNYEKYPREEFSPGQEVLLYAEVANIHSEPIPDGKFRTSLKSTLEILRHGQQGEAVEKIDLPETVDICRTHRRDYFHSYQFTIPTKLSLGPHVLKLTVEDQLSHRVTTYTLNFMVK